MTPSRSILCLSILSALACLAPSPAVAPDGPTGSGQDLKNCDIDIRPAPPLGRGEAQVYWGEIGGSTPGAKATIYVIMNGVLTMGTGDASMELGLKAGQPNEVSWWWDAHNNVLKFRLDNHVDTPIEIDTTDYVGKYDRLGRLKEPTWEYVRRGVGDKLRMRMTMKNFGIEAAFTLSDA